MLRFFYSQNNNWKKAFIPKTRIFGFFGYGFGYKTQNFEFFGFGYGCENPKIRVRIRVRKPENSGLSGTGSGTQTRKFGFLGTGSGVTPSHPTAPKTRKKTGFKCMLLHRNKNLWFWVKQIFFWCKRVDPYNIYLKCNLDSFLICLFKQ
jgi:hypothetical protein